MTSLSKKKPAVVAKTARKVRLTASEVGFAKANNIPLAEVAKAKLPKRGRPAGSKNKSAARAKAFKHPNDVANLLARIEELETIRDRLHKLIDHLEHKEIQYRAVIDYLETKLEIE